MERTLSTIYNVALALIIWFRTSFDRRTKTDLIFRKSAKLIKVKRKTQLFPREHAREKEKEKERAKERAREREAFKRPKCGVCAVLSVVSKLAPISIHCTTHRWLKQLELEKYIWFVGDSLSMYSNCGYCF